MPLHRRGKSKTYEALEDLLREAGYKETRIFTPESERTDRRAAEEQRVKENAGDWKYTLVRLAIEYTVERTCGIAISIDDGWLDMLNHGRCRCVVVDEQVVEAVRERVMPGTNKSSPGMV